MFRFGIRDVLWLTVVVALAVSWWVDNRRIQSKLTQIDQEARTQREAVDKELRQRRGGLDFEIGVYQRLRADYDKLIETAKKDKEQRDEQGMLAAVKRSAELGAPQPNPLPAGFGERPN